MFKSYMFVTEYRICQRVENTGAWNNNHCIQKDPFSINASDTQDWTLKNHPSLKYSHCQRKTALGGNPALYSSHYQSVHWLNFSTIPILISSGKNMWSSCQFFQKFKHLTSFPMIYALIIMNSQKIRSNWKRKC